jgi:dipeptidyl aminopeptidase/acylaminoacyl peptidase
MFCHFELRHFRLALPFLMITSWFVMQAATLTPDQAIKSRSITGLTFSPDGSYLACVVSDPPKGAAPESHIWILDTPHTQFRQFTFSTESESSPRWSADSRTLAFLSDRGERMQIFLIRSDGGEASPLTSGKNAVSAFRWSPDGKEIAFLAPEPKNPKLTRRKKTTRTTPRSLIASRILLVFGLSISFQRRSGKLRAATGALKILTGSQPIASWP